MGYGQWGHESVGHDSVILNKHLPYWVLLRSERERIWESVRDGSQKLGEARGSICM